MRKLWLAGLLALFINNSATASEDKATLLHCASNEGKNTNVWIGENGSWFGRRVNKRIVKGPVFWRYQIDESDDVITFEHQRLAYMKEKDLMNGDLSKQMHCFPIQNPFTQN